LATAAAFKATASVRGKNDNTVAGHGEAQIDQRLPSIT